MKTGTWTNLIFLIYVTIAPITADEDSKSTSKSILSPYDTPLFADANPGNIVPNLLKEIVRPLLNDVSETAANTPISGIVRVTNSTIISEFLKDLDILKREIDCNLLNVVPDVNLKTLICQTIALNDYLQRTTASINLELDHSLQSLLSSILETVVHLLRSIELGLDHSREFSDNRNANPTLRSALDPAQFDQFVKNESTATNPLVLKALWDVMDETLNIMNGEPMKSATGALMNCTNEWMDQILDSLEGKVTICGLDWAIRELRMVINEIYKQVEQPLLFGTQSSTDDTPNLPIPMISTPWPLPMPLSPVPLPLSSASFPPNPAPFPPSPAPFPLSPAPFPPSPTDYPPSPTPVPPTSTSLPLNFPPFPPNLPPLPQSPAPLPPSPAPLPQSPIPLPLTSLPFFLSSIPLPTNPFVNSDSNEETGSAENSSSTYN